MNRLGLIPCLGALLTLPGCVVTYGLGETAEETSDGSGEGTAVDTDTGASTDPDPSASTDPDPTATSGQPGTTDPSDTATGQVPETSDGSATETDGEPADCEHDPDYAQWLFNGENNTPLAGITPSFVAILDANCMVGEIIEAVPEVGDPQWTVPLDCSVWGRIDDDADFAGELSFELLLYSNVGYELVSSIGDEVRLKLVLDWWGFDWNGWLVLENRNTGHQLLDLVKAEYVDPLESTWGEQVGDVMPGPWRNTLSVGVAEDECGGIVGECGDEPRAVAMGIGPDYQQRLHAWQEGTMNSEALFLLYRASVTSAIATPVAKCTDLPLASYAFAIWMQSQ